MSKKIWAGAAIIAASALALSGCAGGGGGDGEGGSDELTILIGSSGSPFLRSFWASRAARRRRSAAET